MLPIGAVPLVHGFRHRSGCCHSTSREGLDVGLPNRFADVLAMCSRACGFEGGLFLGKFYGFWLRTLGVVLV